MAMNWQRANVRQRNARQPMTEEEKNFRLKLASIAKAQRVKKLKRKNKKVQEKRAAPEVDHS